MKSLSIGTEVCGTILLDLIQFIGLFSLFFPDSLGPQSCGRGFCQNRGNYEKQMSTKKFCCTFIQVSANDPKGKEWTKVDGTMSQIR